MSSALRLRFRLGAGLPSRLIAWYGQGYNGWSHVDAQLPDGALLGARSDKPGGTPSGVQVRPANYEPAVRQELLELPCSWGVAAMWETLLLGQVGKEYDPGAIWGFIEGEDDHQAGHWICSALQTWALERCGILPAGFSRLIKPQQVAPNSLHLMFLALGARVAP